MAFNVKLTVPQELQSVPERIDQTLLEATNEATTLVNNAAIDNAPRKYGTLKRSIYPEVVANLGSFTGKVIQDSTVASYGVFVEEGTGVYHEPDSHSFWTVEPVNKKALAFKIGGQTIIRRKVTIQGMKARPFMKPALENNKSKVQEIFQSKIAEVIGGK